jgi:hypothetical protein
MIDFVTEEIVDLVFDHVYQDRKYWGRLEFSHFKTKYMYVLRHDV